MSPAQNFETRDHELASTLCAMGRVVDRIRWETQDDGRPFGIFVFIGDQDGLEDVANSFFRGDKMEVSPQALFAAHKKLRTWLYEERDKLGTVPEKVKA